MTPNVFILLLVALLIILLGAVLWHASGATPASWTHGQARWVVRPYAGEYGLFPVDSNLKETCMHPYCEGSKFECLKAMKKEVRKEAREKAIREDKPMYFSSLGNKVDGSP